MVGAAITHQLNLLVMKKIILYLLLVALSSFITGNSKNKPKHILPFPKGSEYKVIQGWNGKYGHTGAANYAYDFIMPIGSFVTASHKGTIIKTESSFEDNTKTPGKENYIIIDHGNNIYSRYYHLTKDGVLVNVGEIVAAGDTIGKSGNSGASAGPHLHFDITKDCFEWGCQTIEFTFKNIKENPLEAGKTYKSN